MTASSDFVDGGLSVSSLVNVPAASIAAMGFLLVGLQVFAGGESAQWWHIGLVLSSMAFAVQAKLRSSPLGLKVMGVALIVWLLSAYAMVSASS